MVEMKIHSQTVLMVVQMVPSNVDLTEKKKVGNLVVCFFVDCLVGWTKGTLAGWMVGCRDGWHVGYMVG